MSIRGNAVGLVVEVDRARFGEEELDTVKDLCEDTSGKLFRIVTFALDSVGIEELLKKPGSRRALISYIRDGNGSPNEGKHYQVEEILAEETPVD